MKVLTVWQPWASLIAIGAKPFEFRAWAPSNRIIGTRIAIQAGARKIVDKEIRALLVQLNSRLAYQSCLDADLARPLLRGILDGSVHVPLGAIVCTAVLAAPRNGFDIAIEYGMPAEQRPNDSDRDGHANFGWPLTAIEQLIPPEPFRGKQGWGEWGGR